MIGFRSFLVMLLLAHPAWAEESLAVQEESRTLAEAGEYDEALALLEAALLKNPVDTDLQLALARTLSWKGDYEKAKAALARMDIKGNADAELLRANLHYYQGEYTQAASLFQDILARHPDYQDARAGLERIRHVTQTAHAYLWQADTGYEFSDFSRRSQANWNQEFVQLTRFLNDRDLALHVKFTRYDQFTNIDTEYEAGIDYRFSSRMYGYGYGAASPGAGFRPRWRLAAGGGARIDQPGWKWPGLWATFDTRYDTYRDTEVANLNPGIRVDLRDGWSIAGRLIRVDQQEVPAVHGWDMRLDGQIKEGLRFYAGFADAPETVAGETVDTQTWFGGLAFDIAPSYTLRIGYTRDDRENSYIRQVLNASVSYRF